MHSFGRLAAGPKACEAGLAPTPRWGGAPLVHDGSIAWLVLRELDARTEDRGHLQPSRRRPAIPAMKMMSRRDTAVYVQVAWSLPIDDRDLVRRAVQHAQRRWNSPTSAVALVELARWFLEREGQPQ